jgi:hypothetical protein
MSCPTKQQSTTRNRYDDFHQVDDNRISPGGPLPHHLSV